MGEHSAGDVLADRYRVVGVIGRGGSAVTYECEDLQQHDHVAVKQLQLWRQGEWKELELFEREARVLAGLDHPCVPRYRDYLQLESAHGPCFYLVRELVPGKSLADLVASGLRLDEQEARHVARQLLVVLGHLHGLVPPVIHRDIKPGNVLRRDDGQLYLVDFGAVRKPDAADGSTVVGTYGYMAPEQFRGAAEPASDLYGVAATVLFLLTHRPPSELPQEGLRVSFRASVSISTPFADWLERMLEPDPRDRYRDVREALAALDSPRTVRKRGTARLPVLIGALIATVLAGGGVAASLLVEVGDEAEAGVDLAAQGSAPAHRPVTAGPYIKPVTTLKGHWGLTFAVAFAGDGQRLVSGSRDGALKLWELSSETVLRTFSGRSGEVMAVALSPDDATLVSGAANAIAIWEVATGKLVRALEGHTGPVRSVAITGDGATIASASVDGTVRVWDAASGKLVHTLQHDGGRVHTVAISRDGKTLLSGGDRNGVRVWDLPSGRLRATWAETPAPVSDVRIAPDDQTVAIASDDGAVNVWLLARDRHVRSLHAHGDEAWALAFSPDGKLLLSGGKDDNICAWDVYSGDLIRRQPARLKGVIDLAFGPDGKQFAAAGADGSIKLWRTPGKIWRPEIPPPDYVPRRAPEPEPKSREETLVREAEEILRGVGEERGAAGRARAVLEQAKAINPRYAPVYLQLARAELKGALIRGNNYDPAGLEAAHAASDRALMLDPKLVRAYVVKGYIHKAENNLGAARKMAEKALALDPSSSRALLLAGGIANRERKDDEALDAAKRVIEQETDPDLLSDAYDVLSGPYKRLGEWDAVEDCYVAQTRLQPKSAWIRGNFADFLNDRDEYDRAIGLAHEALALMDYPMGRKTLSSAHAGKAAQLVYRDDLAAAAEQIALADKAFSRNDDLEYTKGYYFRHIAMKERSAEKLAEAKRHFEAALTLDDDHAGAKRALQQHPEWEAKLARSR